MTFDVFLSWILPWIHAITAVVTAATAVTALTPSTADDRYLNMLLKVLNILAGNVGANTNADAVPLARAGEDTSVRVSPAPRSVADADAPDSRN